jgi:hypothetical protein
MSVSTLLNLKIKSMPKSLGIQIISRGNRRDLAKQNQNQPPPQLWRILWRVIGLNGFLIGIIGLNWFSQVSETTTCPGDYHLL